MLLPFFPSYGKFTVFKTPVFSSNLIIPLDLVSHTNTKHTTYTCSVCNLILNSRVIFQSHMTSFHRDAIMKCEICSYKSYLKDCFEKHKRMHTEYKQCTVEGCNESFFTEEKLDAHFNRFHRQERVHKCTVAGCTEAFYNAKKLLKHLIDDHKESPFKCTHESCLFKTNNQRVLSLHIQTHSIDRPFPCTDPDCNQAFRTKPLLESPLKHKHTTEKAFGCEVEDCDRKFKTKYQLLQHHKRFHGDGNSPALYWQAEPKDLLQQLRSRPGSSYSMRLFKCPFPHCNAHFGKRPELTKHVKDCEYQCIF